MTPDSLGTAIERRFRTARRDASRVVERRSPYLGDSVGALALTVPAVAWQMFGGIGTAERVSWLAWTWLLALTAPALRSRRPRR